MDQRLTQVEIRKLGKRVSSDRPTVALLKRGEAVARTGIATSTRCEILDLEWHTKAGVRHLRVWVSGKTGGRWLIAKHEAVAVLERLYGREQAWQGRLLE